MVSTELFRYYGKDFANETQWMLMERKRENIRVVKALGGCHET